MSISEVRTQNSELRKKVFIFFSLFSFLFSLFSFAQDKPSSGELIVKAWAVHGEKNIEETFKITQQLIDLYQDEAQRLQVSLKSFPKTKREIEGVAILNDVATAYFIQGESYRYQGKTQEAIEAFKTVVYKYCFAQAWDPRGWYWKVALAAYESIVKLSPKESLPVPPCPGLLEKEKEKEKAAVGPPSKITLYDPGTEDIVNYQKYGEFQNIGTKDYKYVIKNQEGLMQAVGEGIYPNTTSIRWDPELKKVRDEGRLKGDHWDFVNTPDLQAAFFKWALAPEPSGVKLFYIALTLEKSGLIKHAVKAYYAIVVHFPSSYGWTYWHTPWYVGQAAIAKIKYLLRNNPQLGYKLEGADIKIINGYDYDVANDVVIVNPGRFLKTGPFEKLKPKLSTKEIKNKRGSGKVRLVQYQNGDWQLLVDDKPFVIKGITYAPTKICQSPDEGTLGNWMEEDFNKNGRADGPYDAFVDKNRNNKQDKDEKAEGDFKLMKEMGVNAIRVYHHPHKVNKELLRELYKKFGIRVIMGDFLGK
ncbi:MAG: tetratricopeptide repeat protein, partial [Candidatus Omnitrophica bacterium]|nr:tetratricopeptide repeat protein [Candidatus Omnitrophota bacterium]